MEEMLVMAGEQCTTLTVLAPTIEIVEVHAFDEHLTSSTVHLYRGRTYHLYARVRNTSDVNLKIQVHFKIVCGGVMIKDLGTVWNSCLSPGDEEIVNSPSFKVTQDICKDESGCNIQAVSNRAALCDGTEFSPAGGIMAGRNVNIWDYKYHLEVMVEPAEIYANETYKPIVVLYNDLPDYAKFPITVKGYWTLNGTKIEGSDIVMYTEVSVSKTIEVKGPSEPGTYELCFVPTDVYY